ncbi:unnamed protein product [Bemisia tabaci]|uniref:Nuclear pore complex protein n=1 Tax=Bemisia tabaci TaxID=7038 RepID=A0A9P0A968_BEMTA|nr:unnamed protein product [Bemisia tabaci]
MNSSSLFKSSFRGLDDTLSSLPSSVQASHARREKALASSFLNDSDVYSHRPSKYLNDLSITINQNEMSELFDSTVATTTTKQPDTVCDSLFREFQEILESHSSSGQIFQTISDLEQNCTNAIEILSENKFNSSAELSRLELERNTWRLLNALYQNRLNPDNMDEDEAMNLFSPSDRDTVALILNNSNRLREWQLVIDWLEKCAADQSKRAMQPMVGHFLDKTVGWENTLYQLQNTQITYQSSRPIITELDPDAPARQKKPLHDLDAEDETRLFEQILAEIRCGRLDSAQSLCYHCGQPWRAAILEGWRLYHDPNYTAADSSELYPIEGNPNRGIWKLCAYRLSEESKCSPIWRGILGALCGNIRALLPVCKQWEDLLWAYVKVLVDVQVEKELRSYSTAAPMPPAYWNYQLSMDEIFQELSGNPDFKIRNEAQKPSRIIQQLLILNRPSELMSTMAQWVTQEACDPHLIRTAAHLVLILRLLGQSFSSASSDTILRAYVKVLMNLRDPNLVAYYTATLSRDDQISLYSQFLETITGLEERAACLEAASVCSLPVEVIVQKVVENSRLKESDLSTTLVPETSEEDNAKISALDWIVFYESQRAEALWQTNALVRYFISHDKLDAARKAFDKIPPNSVVLVLTQHHCSVIDDVTDFSRMPSRVNCAVREFLCYKAYLAAEESFVDWFKLLNERPQMLNELPETATYSEKVAYEHLIAQYKNEYKRWKLALDHQTKAVKETFHNMILFPDGGWLRDPPNTEQDDPTRAHQMAALRKLCIPKMVLLLHKVLHSNGDYQECIQLSELVVDETHKIYKEYGKQELNELLLKICDSSAALLDENKDAFGYPLSS